MDTEKCAALLCALEEGTLARAAERLGYTPSGISRMVAALEDETGFPLLLREHGGEGPKELAARLVTEARGRGSDDDRTAIVMRVEKTNF